MYVEHYTFVSSQINKIQFTYILAVETYLYARRLIMRRTKTCSIIDTSSKQLCSTAMHLEILKKKSYEVGHTVSNITISTQFILKTTPDDKQTISVVWHTKYFLFRSYMKVTEYHFGIFL